MQKIYTPRRHSREGGNLSSRRELLRGSSNLTPRHSQLLPILIILFLINSIPAFCKPNQPNAPCKKKEKSTIPFLKKLFHNKQKTKTFHYKNFQFTKKNSIENNNSRRKEKTLKWLAIIGLGLTMLGVCFIIVNAFAGLLELFFLLFFIIMASIIGIPMYLLYLILF